MKLILSTLVAAGLATSAFAGNSDRYHDLRLDTAKGHVSDAAAKVDAIKTAPVVSFSTRNSEKKPTTYPYINPYGVGPYNDSR